MEIIARLWELSNVEFKISTGFYYRDVILADNLHQSSTQSASREGRQ